MSRDTLFAAFLDGSLDADGAAELLQLLQNDPAAAEELAGLQDVDLVLESLARTPGDAELLADLVLRSIADPDRRDRLAEAVARDIARIPNMSRTRSARAPEGRGIVFAAIAAAAALFALILLVSSADRPQPRPSAAGSPAPRPAEARRNVQESRQEPAPAPQTANPARPGESASELEERKRRVEEELKAAIERRKPVFKPTPDVPETPPPPPPAPPAPEPPKVIPTRTAVATLTDLQGEANAVREGNRRALRKGDPLLEGDDIETASGAAGAVLAYGDGTTVAAGPNTFLRGIVVEGAKRLRLERGSVRAVVKRQPQGRPMVFATPYGEATVLGTTLQIAVDPEGLRGMRLEVEEGKVDLKNREGKSVLVESGHFAVAAAGVDLASRPVSRAVLQETFADPKVLRDRWIENPRGLPFTVQGGTLDIDTTPRNAGAAPGGTWQTPGGLRTRLAYRLPLEVSAEFTLSQATDSAAAVVLLKPASVIPGEGDSVYSARNVVHVSRSGTEVQLMVQNVKVARVDAPLPVGKMERMTLEMDQERIRVTLDGRELAVYRHSLQIQEPYQIGVEATSRLMAPAGGHVRFKGAVVTRAAAK